MVGDASLAARRVNKEAHSFLADILQHTCGPSFLELKNDLKFLMPKIEEALYRVHEAAREEKSKACDVASDKPVEGTETPAQPFARVNAVAPDSPAAEGVCESCARCLYVSASLCDRSIRCRPLLLIYRMCSSYLALFD